MTHHLAGILALVVPILLGLGACSTPVELPYEPQIAEAELSSWMAVDETKRESDWQVIDDRYRQLESVGVVHHDGAFDGIYHLGTYLLLQGGEKLTDYSFFADVSMMSELGGECGLMWRVHDQENYYRLSTSYRDGFTFLQKKVAGKWSTLAKNARGLPTSQTSRFVVTVSGPLTQIHQDGKGLFAFTDSNLSAGSVALYARDDCGFSNLSIKPPSNDPSIVISTPADYSVTPMLAFDVAAVVINQPVRSQVKFRLSDGKCNLAQESIPGVYVASCEVTSPGSYDLTAELLEGTLIVVEDERQPVTVGGMRIATAGDSHTNGRGDTLARDGTSVSGRRVSMQGFQANLEDLLAQGEPPIPAIVFNAGISGDWTAWLRNRIDGFIEQHQDADVVLLMSGTNDVINRQPSGWGCVAEACTGTYADEMHQVIQALNDARKTVWVALMPPVFGDRDEGFYLNAVDHPKNQQVLEFNKVITEQLDGYQLGPNFYHYFLGQRDRGYLFADVYHLNGLGQQVMAHLWHNSITGSVGLPLIVEGISVKLSTAASPIKPMPYQQNLLEAGDHYFVDSDWKLREMPADFDDARWIMTNDAHRVASNADYLSLDLGAATADIYVAFPVAKQLPAWLRDWQPTRLVVTTDHPQALNLELYRNANVTGVVELGGANSQVTGAASNYVVAVMGLTRQ